ncbi:ty3-gypsy retrotransposon protein [Cucumis melo var. makuwa]|uniref:Ty3-gypsy retrotransposon protein n=1 Tax=Cucumis melo var. makuwa TaxID=1194695 RepID=A0A5A7UVZ6_CUCMM|nr:ty3-gypsy retrotransposon protein [Cucumis melo var. makuwa]
MQTRQTAKASETLVVEVGDKGKNVVQENQPQQQSTYVASLLVQQLQDMIENSIRAQYGGLPQTSFILKENAFEWYIDLDLEVIDSWEQLEKEFVNCFYNTRRTISMMELTNTKQWKGEPVIDYINLWRALSLDCKEKLIELFVVEMCTQGMHWKLLNIMQGIKPRTFQELVTHAHDMELSIANRGAKDFLVQKMRNDKNEMNDTKKIANSVINEHVRPVAKESTYSTARMQTLEQARKVVDPNYFKYHQVVEKCSVLKELILKLAHEKKIKLDIDEIAQTNHIAVEMTSSVLPLTYNFMIKEKA